MKQRFNKLLAVVLAASLCLPMMPPERVDAAGNGVVFTEEEQVFVNDYGKERSTVINDGWKFYLGSIGGASDKELNDAGWDNVDLPHDFSITQDFTARGEAESGFLPGGTGWYRKHFTLSDSLAGKRIVLNFDGVYSRAAVYVNGTKVGEHHYGYTPFAFDITDYVVCDSATDNVIAVEAVNNIPSSRWYSGSGIYRDVKLMITDPVHVAWNGTHVTTPNLKESNGSDGTVSTSVEVQNDGGAAANVTVRNTVFEKGGNTAVATAQKTAEIPAGGTVVVETEAAVASPKLWSIEQPNLYYVRTEILQGTTVLDTYDSEFGFKWYEFVDNEGFKLNGKNVKINGVCMHHDQGALGSAAYRDAIYRQMSIMKEMGTNTIRITHNPGAEVLVDVCNELGLLVIEEAFDGWAWPKNGNSQDFSTHFRVNLTEDNQIIDGDASMTWAEFTIKAMVKRDRNDASIILWSLGNEIQEGTADNRSWDWGAIADDLIKWTEEIDTAHPVTSGSNRRNITDNIAPVNRKVYESGGVPGFNYGDINEMRALHETYPVMLWSETASAINSRSVYTDNSTGVWAIGGHLTSYDESCVGWGKQAHQSMWPVLNNDWIAGECVWTGFDYIGEPTPWNVTGTGIHVQAPDKSIAAPNSSYFGIVETTGFPKDNYYLYRSQWNHDADTLHLVTAWDPDNMKESNGKTPVWVYSNAALVELYRDDTLIGTATRKDISETTTDAGHVHYEYTTQSEDNSICTTSSGSGDTSLYSVFNVAFAEGTISARAYDEAGNEITDQCVGNSSVSTPGEASKLEVSQDKTEILADGSSLVYITVDVTDADGNLDTTAKDEITFDLQGEGQIMGVDNGDQATINKYQQASVLTGPTSAHIKAYAGKALVIVRAGKKSGKITVTASANGLDGDQAEITAKMPEGQAENAIASYRIAKHCYVPAGTTSITLPATTAVVRADGKEETLGIKWGNYDPSLLKKTGIFTISGTVGSGLDQISVAVTVHVYGNIVAAKNISSYTAPGTMPLLPTSLMTYTADGTEFEAFPVAWDTKGISADDFTEVGTVKTINGTVTASYLNKTFAVTASVRVPESKIGESTNIAPSAAELLQNCSPISDDLNSIIDGSKYSDPNGAAGRWTDWNDDRADKDTNPPAITMKWDTVHAVDEIRLYYYTDTNMKKPGKVTIKLSSDGINFTEMGYQTPTEIIPGIPGEASEGEILKLNENTTPIAVQIVMERDGRAVGLTEAEVMSRQYVYDVYKTADLTGISVGGRAIDGFAADKADYVVDALAEVTGQSDKNVAVTVLPEDNGVVTILTSAEDGSAARKYTVSRKVKQEEAAAITQEINTLKALDSSKYTQESYAALMQAIRQFEGKTLTELSAKEFNEMKKVLEAAKNALVAVPAPDPGQKPDQPQPPVPEKPAIEKNQKATVNKMTYKVVDPVKKTVQLTKGDKKKKGKVTIDKVKVNGVQCTVVSIADKALKGADKITSVTIGSSVTSIGKNAFAGCKKLKSVTFGKKVKTIDASAFSGCKLLNKVVFKGTAVKNVKSKAFKGTAKKVAVQVPKSLKKAKRNTLRKKLINAGMSKNITIK